MTIDPSSSSKEIARAKSSRSSNSATALLIKLARSKIRPKSLPATEAFLELQFGQSAKLPGLPEPQNAASVKWQRKFLTHPGFRIRWFYRKTHASHDITHNPAH